MAIFLLELQHMLKPVPLIEDNIFILKLGQGSVSQDGELSLNPRGIPLNSRHVLEFVNFISVRRGLSENINVSRHEFH